MTAQQESREAGTILPTASGVYELNRSEIRHMESVCSELRRTAESQGKRPLWKRPT